MKTKNVFLLTLSVVAALVIAGCSDNEDMQDPAIERGVVKAEFTISFPQKVSGTTRMSEAVVQGQMNNEGTAQEPVFRGIQDIKLYAFTAAKKDITSGTPYTQPIVLRGGTTVSTSGASGTSANTIASTGALYENSKSHLYQDVEIPIGTRTFMFYGQAARTATDSYQTEGVLADPFGSTSGLSTLANLTFSPKPFTTDPTPSSNGVAVIRYLNAIAGADAGTAEEPNKWNAVTSSIRLRSLYDTFITINTGSWASVKAAVQQLYTSVNAIITASSEADATDAEKNTKTVAEAVKNAIENTTITESGSDKFVTGTDAGTLTFSTLDNYPADMGLPDGAAQVFWNGNSFAAVTAEGLTGMNVAALTNYAYPAALWYRALSEIYVSESSKSSFYNDNSWETILEKYKNTDNTYNKEVNSKTRSIVMVDPAHYAVGRFDVTIEATSWSVKDYVGNSFDVSAPSQNIRLTGVLIGGQKAVDYEFKPSTIASAANPTVYTIYDSKINGYEKAPSPEYIYLTNQKSKKNYTLVLETAAATSADDKVKIALEFLNNSSKIIVGQNGCYIYPGTKFYLVGNLEPWNNYIAIEGIKYKDTNDKINQAFIQDYVTTANFKIQSLKTAYNTLPDLTLPQLELGLSVELNWKEGITQEISIE